MSRADLSPAAMKVTVIMTTFNHEPFIAQSVNSALMQEVDFDYEIVIIEDCSTDRTRQIVLDLQKQHPERIRLILPDANRNDSRNFAHAIHTSRSQYIACLEGDDYWTSPLKLQNQVEFLDSHPECAICFHNVRQLWEDGRTVVHNPPTQKSFSDMPDILAGNFIATVSVMFRRGLFGEFPEWYFRLPIGDWPLHIMNTEYGRIGYLAQTMAVYRVHSRGLWSSRSRRQQLETVIRLYRELNANLEYRYDDLIRVNVAKNWYVLAEVVEYNSGDFAYARSCIRNCFLARPFGNPMPWTQLAGKWLKLCAKSCLRWKP